MDSSRTLQPSLNSSYVSRSWSSEEEEEEEEEEDSEDLECTTTPTADGAPLLGKGRSPSGLPLAKRHSPRDAYCLVYVSFFLMGIGSLLPWNLFITAKHYWTYKLSNHSAPGQEPRSDLMDYFESYLSIASTVPSVLCLVLNYLLVNRVSPSARILSSLGVILLLFVLTTALVPVDVSEHQREFFAGTLATVAMVSGASNLFTGSVFGISGLFPMRISQALISGQAMGGTLTAVAAILDLAATEEVTGSALAYFLTADVFIVLCIGTYLLLPRLTYARHYMSLAKCSAPCPDGGAGPPPASGSSSVSVPPLLPILRKVWVLGLSVFYVFSVSIMVFPALSSGIQSVDKASGSPWTNTYFVPLSSFLLYQTADFCGRQVTAWLQVPGPTSMVLPALVLCRTLMLPLFMFCNYQPRDHLHTVLFANDLYPIVFNCALGLSNGYLGTLPMIYGPKVVPRELAEATGVVMSFFLTLGLAVGSAFSVVIVHAI